MTSDHSSETYSSAAKVLLQSRSGPGYWVGKLSSSALSTATASFALFKLDQVSGNLNHAELVGRGVSWLAGCQNIDGGWGDTAHSPSNISTTTLCWAALSAIAEGSDEHAESIDRAACWLNRLAGELTPLNLAAAISTVYGVDRTFSVPILTMCALAGRFGEGTRAWKHVRQLPFELAAFPHGLFNRLGLPVVSYALPALIAIGQARHYHRPSKCPLTRILRHMLRNRTLSKLESIQPSTGGFLEAAPLTSFVLMSLSSIGLSKSPVAVKSTSFLEKSAHPDGSWPIDTNLATWLTTLSINGLGGEGLSKEDRTRLSRWLLDQQCKTKHPYTHAAPGGWAWTDLAGGVPDADDTAGALLALKTLTGAEPEYVGNLADGVNKGVNWLLDLQNRDGGIPTFCRGWGKLPFDRSAPDLTAHALRAWQAWRSLLPAPLKQRVDEAANKAIQYLLANQRSDGAWIPLWFGNQESSSQENPVHGTSRVLLAHQVRALDNKWSAAVKKAGEWLLSMQNDDGGWGGDSSTPSTVEETALAIEGLAAVKPIMPELTEKPIKRGLEWLDRQTCGGKKFPVSPIGLYFAKLWYHEELYPIIFTVAALRTARTAD